MKRIISFLLAAVTAVLILPMLAACDNGNGEPSDSSTAEQSDRPKLAEIVSAGTARFSVVRPDMASRTEIDAAKTIRAAIQSATGVLPDIDNDFAKKPEDIDNDSYEILIGNTNREASQSLLASLGDSSYAISVTERKVAIVAAHNIYLDMAVEYFTTLLMNADTEGTTIGEGVFTLAPFEIRETAKKPLYMNLREDIKYAANYKQLFDIQFTDGLTCVQGGTIANGFYYVALNKGETDMIIKYDMEGNVLAKSQKMMLTHANDIAYNPDKNQLLVSHCMSPYGERAEILDADTLESVGYHDFDFVLSCIDYCPEKKQYVTSRNGQSIIDIWDENFNHVVSYTPGMTGNVTQGLCCTEDYIVMVQYQENVMLIYDWTGNLIANIALVGYAIEAERVSFVGDTIYIGCNNHNWSGGILTTVTIDHAVK